MRAAKKIIYNLSRRIKKFKRQPVFQCKLPKICFGLGFKEQIKIPIEGVLVFIFQHGHIMRQSFLSSKEWSDNINLEFDVIIVCLSVPVY